MATALSGHDYANHSMPTPSRGHGTPIRCVDCAEINSRESSMKSRTHCLLAVLVMCLASVHARAQEGQPGYHPPGAPGAPGATGPENKYVELSHSKDRVIKATAERYLNLVKFQEWGGASGKSQMAKYVSHDSDLKRVKLSVAKGSGKDRVVKEFDVEVDKLNKA